MGAIYETFRCMMKVQTMYYNMKMAEKNLHIRYMDIARIMYHIMQEIDLPYVGEYSDFSDVLCSDMKVNSVEQYVYNLNLTRAINEEEKVELERQIKTLLWRRGVAPEYQKEFRMTHTVSIEGHQIFVRYRHKKGGGQVSGASVAPATAPAS